MLARRLTNSNSGQDVHSFDERCTKNVHLEIVDVHINLLWKRTRIINLS